MLSSSRQKTSLGCNNLRSQDLRAGPNKGFLKTLDLAFNYGSDTGSKLTKWLGEPPCRLPSLDNSTAGFKYLTVNGCVHRSFGLGSIVAPPELAGTLPIGAWRCYTQTHYQLCTRHNSNPRLKSLASANLPGWHRVPYCA